MNGITLLIFAVQQHSHKGASMKVKMAQNDVALDRLQGAARKADHTAKDMVTVQTADLIFALREMDTHGIIHLDLD